MKRWKSFVPIILLFIAICISLEEFLIRDLWAAKVFPAIFFIVSFILFIVAVRYFVKKGNI